MAHLKVPSENLTFENARLQWRNFGGEEKTFNAKGKRNFCLMLDNQEQAEALEELGWPIKYAKPLEEDGVVVGDLRPFIKVDLKWTPRSQPRVRLINSRGMMAITEDTAFALDYTSIEKVDLTIRAFKWEWSGKEGVKAMLNSLYMTVKEDELDRKYANVPEVDMRGNPIAALTSAEDYQNPFANQLEDMGEVEGQREITSGF
jgi:hypothetical protein